MIYIPETLKSAFSALALNKLRTFLTMLGVIIGVFSVVALVAVVQGFQNYITDQFDALGSNLVLVTPKLQEGQDPSAGLRAEDESVTRCILRQIMAYRSFGAQGEQPWGAELAQTCNPIVMNMDLRQLRIIHPGTAQLRCAEIEAERLDEVQMRADIGAQANDVAGVGRDFGLIEDDVEHAGENTC